MNDPLFIHSDVDDAGLSLPAFRLLCHIARRLGKPGVFPGADSMAKVCRMDKKTVFRALQELQDAGIIERISRPGLTNEYAIRPLGTWGAKRVDPKATPGGQTGRGVGCQTGHHLTQMAPHEDTPSKGIQEGNPPSWELGLELEFENPQRAKDTIKKASANPSTTETGVRLGNVFHRTARRQWSEKEIKALKQLMPIPQDELEAVEAYYAAHYPPARNVNALRHDLVTLLNNWSGEVDRANAWAAAPPPPNFASQKIKFA